jgi:hypothetical protein
MKRNVEELYDRETLNKLKRCSNELEAETGVDLLKLVEEGALDIAGICPITGDLMFLISEQFVEAYGVPETKAI